MPKDKPIPGKMVNEAKKVDMKGIVGSKGKNLSGPPRSAGIKPGSQPGKKSFTKVRRIGGRGR